MTLLAGGKSSYIETDKSNLQLEDWIFYVVAQQKINPPAMQGEGISLDKRNSCVSALTHLYLALLLLTPKQQ